MRSFPFYRLSPLSLLVYFTAEVAAVSSMKCLAAQGGFFAAAAGAELLFGSGKKMLRVLSSSLLPAFVIFALVAAVILSDSSKRIRHRSLNEAGAYRRARYYLNRINVVGANAGRESVKKRIDIFSVGFSLCGYYNLCGFTLGINSYSKKNFTCIALLFDGYYVAL